MKLALCLIVRGDDKEAELLARCLGYSASYVDGIFITITQPNEKVESVCNLYGAHISRFDWCDDFAKARNFNFSQVPKDYDYIFWLDADDAPRGLERLKDTIKKHKADAYSMMYLYAFDEERNPIVVHQKTRVIKNDGCVEWAGALHEDFKENRSVKRYHIEGIDILHLTDNQRVDLSKTRNLQVAEKMAQDKPNDPRSYWNLGNALRAKGEYERADMVFNAFLKMSKSDDEKYIVRLRMSENAFAQKKLAIAQEHAQYAIGLKPNYPDAYNLMGHICFEQKQYEKALDYFKQGLVKPTPTYQIIVYNPRDYDYTPMMAMAKCYFNLSLPQLALPLLEACLKIYPNNESIKKTVKIMRKESGKADKVLKIIGKLKKINDKNKLKRELDKLPDEFQSHPAICNIRNVHFIKQESSGKDLVIYCGYTEEEWNPETAEKKGIGGSEEAVINLSKELVKLGWNVEVYNNCGYREKQYNGVNFKPYWTWNPRDKQDITILWRHPRPIDYAINSKVYVDLHDVVPQGEFNEERLKKIEKIFVKSQAHRELFPDVPDDKFVIIPNGIDVSKFNYVVPKDPYLMLNTSSPDRSIGTLIELFKEVKKRVPQIKMRWAYGWNVFDSAHANDGQIMAWKADVMKRMDETEGWESLGRVNHDEVAKLYQEAVILAYPTEFYEIDCISVRKAQLAGCVPITTDFAALKETNKFGVKIHSEKTKDNWCKDYQYHFGLEDDQAKKEWVDKCVETLQNPPDTFDMRVWAKKFNWQAIAERWNDELKLSR